MTSLALDTAKKVPELFPETPRVDLGHIPELDGLRGFAALAVYVLHIMITVRDVPNQVISPVVRPFLQLADAGVFGVDIFFVLSGFLITCLLLIDREKPHYYGNFYWKRVLRIQPVNLLHLLGTWLFLPGSDGYVLLAFFFLANFAEPLHVATRGPAWTLSIEEQFYLLWPQVIRRAKVETIYKIAFGLIFVSVGARLFMSLVFHRMSVRYTFYRLDGLGLGALLALQWMGSRPAWARARPALNVLNSSALLMTAIAYVVWSIVFPLRSEYALSLFFVNVLVYRLIRFILLRPGATRTAWLRSSPMIFLGAISYSLYMFHTIVIFCYDERFGPGSFQPKVFLLRTVVVSASTLALCVASRYMVELPVQRLRRFVLR